MRKDPIKIPKGRRFLETSILTAYNQGFAAGVAHGLCNEVERADAELRQRLRPEMWAKLEKLRAMRAKIESEECPF